MKQLTPHEVAFRLQSLALSPSFNKQQIKTLLDGAGVVRLLNEQLEMANANIKGKGEEIEMLKVIIDGLHRKLSAEHDLREEVWIRLGEINGVVSDTIQETQQRLTGDTDDNKSDAHDHSAGHVNGSGSYRNHA